MYYDGAYAPFGEAYAQTGTADISFTGMNQDTVANLYDFPARELNDIHGRWPSPDPAGRSSVQPNDPQTWNRYTYARNSPLYVTDPTGMILSDCDWTGCGGGGFGGGGGGGGSVYVDGMIQTVSTTLGGNELQQCPNNQCQIWSNGQYFQFQAFADGSAGYLPFSAPPGYSLQDITSAAAVVATASHGTPVDPSTLSGQAAAVYSLLTSLGVSAENITIYQTGSQSFSAVLTDAGFDQLQQSSLFDSNFGDSFLHYPYTDGGRSDQTPSLHGVWFDENLTDFVGGSGFYMQFHSDSSNPYNGGFWQHWGCDMLGISCGTQ